jgi:hypothetical protein
MVFNMPIRPSIFYRRTALTLALMVLCILSIALPPHGRAHEPITTKVTFNKEIIRILQRNCLVCHVPGKIQSDIPLGTYEDARPWAKAIKEEILEKRMMPYQAVKGFGVLQHNYILPQRDVDLIVSWVEGGAPRGDDKDYPKRAVEELMKGTTWSLGQPDLILQPEKEIKIEAEASADSPAGSGDITRCFILPAGLKEDRWISALEFQPGNAAVVYAASVFIERKALPRAPNIVNRDDCSSINGRSGLESLANWVPGQAANRLPAGIARALPAGSRLVMIIHYRINGEAAVDRSRIGLFFAKEEINKAARVVPIKATERPPNADRQPIKISYPISESTEAVAIRPLLFPLARSVEATAYRPDGTIEILIWAKNYRFDWQPTYYFKKPVTLPKGTRIEVTAYPAEDNGNNRLINPHTSSKPSKFNDSICELLLTSTAPTKQARR